MTIWKFIFIVAFCLFSVGTLISWLILINVVKYGLIIEPTSYTIVVYNVIYSAINLILGLSIAIYDLSEMFLEHIIKSRSTIILNMVIFNFGIIIFIMHYINLWISRKSIRKELIKSMKNGSR